MTDDTIANASTSEVAELARRTLERLMDKYAGLTPAERESLTAARIAAVGELARREDAATAERKAGAAAARADEIRSELSRHAAATQGDTEDAARERKLRAPRMAQLMHEAALLEGGLAS